MERGAFSWLSKNHSIDFNSHAHVERDIISAEFRHVCTISTHTLTWSVTGISIPMTGNDSAFQLTRSRGAWQNNFQWDYIPMIFQLTRSRGAWPQLPLPQCPSIHFKLCNRRHWTTSISTHTLTWSVTCLADWLKYENVIISTHTLTWSVTE